MKEFAFTGTDDGSFPETVSLFVVFGVVLFMTLLQTNTRFNLLIEIIRGTLTGKLAATQNLELDDPSGHHHDLPTEADHRLLTRPQPFFKYSETKEHFVIVVPPGCMLFEQLTDSLRAKILIDPRPMIE